MKQNKMDQMKVEKSLVGAPVAIGLGAIEMAGLGYFAWRNRSKIAQFFQSEKEAQPSHDSLTAKPKTHVLHYAEKVSAAK